MQLQEAIYAAVKKYEAEGEPLNWVKHLSRTSVINIADYPAVIIEEQDFDYSQAVAGKTQRQECVIAVVIACDGQNDLTEDAYLSVKTDLEGKVSDTETGLVPIIYNELRHTANGISEPDFGKGDQYPSIIGDKSVLVAMIPVSALVLISN